MSNAHFRRHARMSDYKMPQRSAILPSAVRQRSHARGSQEVARSGLLMTLAAIAFTAWLVWLLNNS